MNYNMAICNLELMKVLCKRIENAEETIDVAISALHELQQYKQLSTLEEVKSKIGAFDHIKWEIDIALEQLEEIVCSLGQKMNEVRAAVRKQDEEAVIERHHSEAEKDIEAYGENTLFGYCPRCGELVNSLWNPCNCGDCGKRIDWGESE